MIPTKRLVPLLVILLAVVIAGVILYQNKVGQQIASSGPSQPAPHAATSTGPAARQAAVKPYRLPSPAVPVGLQIYQIAQAAEVWPKIIQATIDPSDVHVGNTQKLSVIVEDSAPIISVEAQIQTDHKTITLPLALTGPVSKSDLMPQKYAVDSANHLVLLDNNQNSEQTASDFPNVASAADLQKLKYEGQWVVHDTHDAYYHTTFVVKDSADNSSSITLTWLDPTPCGFPNGGDWTISSPCTISAMTHGVDNGNLTLASAITLSNAGVLVFNPGFKMQINSGGSIAICSGCSILKTYLWGLDADHDGYAAGTSWTASNSSPGNGYVRRYTFPLYGYLGDCNDNNPNVNPAAIGFSTPTTTNMNLGTQKYDGQGEVNFDYNCDGVETKDTLTYSNGCTKVNCDLNACTDANCSDNTPVPGPACGQTFTEYFGCALNPDADVSRSCQGGGLVNCNSKGCLVDNGYPWTHKQTCE